MGGGGPLSPDLPALYKFFNSTLTPHRTAGLTAVLFLYFSLTTVDKTPPPKHGRSFVAHTPKDLQ